MEKREREWREWSSQMLDRSKVMSSLSRSKLSANHDFSSRSPHGNNSNYEKGNNTGTFLGMTGTSSDSALTQLKREMSNLPLNNFLLFGQKNVESVQLNNHGRERDDNVNDMRLDAVLFDTDSDDSETNNFNGTESEKGILTDHNLVGMFRSNRATRTNEQLGIDHSLLKSPSPAWKSSWSPREEELHQIEQVILELEEDRTLQESYRDELLAVRQKITALHTLPSDHLFEEGLGKILRTLSTLQRLSADFMDDNLSVRTDRSLIVQST